MKTVRTVILLALLFALAVNPSWAASKARHQKPQKKQKIGHVLKATQSGSYTDLKVTSLTVGNCVQAGPGGKLASSTVPCLTGVGAIPFAVGGSLPVTGQNGFVTTGGAATAVIPAPILVGTGDALIAVVDWFGPGVTAGTFTPPVGFTQLRTDPVSGGNGIFSGWFCKQATGSEPANYTFGFSVAGNGVTGAVIDVKGVQCSDYDTGSAGSAVSLGPVTAPSFATLGTNELVLSHAAAGQGVYLSPNSGSAVVGSNANNGGWLVYRHPTPGMVAGPVTYSIQNHNQTPPAVNSFLVSLVAFKNPIVNSSTAIINNEQGALLSSLVTPLGLGMKVASPNEIWGFSINGHINPVSFGADPSGNHESSDEIQAAIDWGCLNGPGAGFTVEFPAGTYLVWKPIFVNCTGKALTMYGAGDQVTKWILGAGSPNVGAQLVVQNVVEPTLYNPILGPPLATAATGQSAGNSLNWGPARNGQRYYYNLSMGMQTTGSQNARLNGLTAFTHEWWFNPVPITGEADGHTYGLFQSSNVATSPYSTQHYKVKWFYHTSGTSVLQACLSTSGSPTNSLNNPPYNERIPNCVRGNLTNNVAQHVAVVYDGAALRLAIGGVWSTAVPATGTVQQSENDDFWMGLAEDSGANSSAAGQIDGMRISSVARYSQAGGNFTPPTQKFVSDGSTIMLMNTLETRNTLIKTLNTNDAPISYTAAIKVTNGSSFAWLVPIHTGCCFEGQSAAYIGRMTIAGPVIVQKSTGIHLADMTIGGGYWGALLLSGETYNAALSNVNIGDSGSPGTFGIRNSSSLHGDHVSIGPGEYQVVGGGEFDHLFTSPGAGTIWDFTIIGGGGIFGNVYLDFFNTDAENGGTSIPLVVGGGINQVSIEHSTLLSAGSAPAISMQGFTGHMKVADTQLDGLIDFRNFHSSLGTSGGTAGRYGWLPAPIVLENVDVAGSTPGSPRGGNPCSIPQNCQIIGGRNQADSYAVMVNSPSIISRIVAGTPNPNPSQTVTVARDGNAVPGDVYITVVSGQYFAGGAPASMGAMTLPAGWSEDLRCGGGTAFGATHRVFYHVAESNDPATFGFGYANTAPVTSVNYLVRGARQTTNPIDACFPSNGAVSSASMTLPGGTASDINSTVIDFIGFYSGLPIGVGGNRVSMVSAPVGAIQITDLGQGDNFFADWYRPGSLTIPATNFTAGFAGAWSGAQMVLGARIQMANVIPAWGAAGSAAARQVTYDNEIAVPFASIAPLIKNWSMTASAPITPDLSFGANQVVTIGDASAWTLNNALRNQQGTWWELTLFNNTAAPGGLITLGSNYLTDSSWPPNGPAAGKRTVCRVTSDASGLDLIRCGGDMPASSGTAIKTLTCADTPYTVLPGVDYIRCNATSCPIVILLPSALGTDRNVTVKKEDATANACTPTRILTNLIDGATTDPITQQFVSHAYKDAGVGTWEIN